jgi:hypothetical protein
MPKELQEKLLKLYMDGCLIKIDSNFVDGFARLYRNSEGQIIFDSDVFAGRALMSVEPQDVTVMVTVPNWTALPL